MWKSCKFIKYIKLESGVPEEGHMNRTLLERIWEIPVLLKLQTFSFISLVSLKGAISSCLNWKSSQRLTKRKIEMRVSLGRGLKKITKQLDINHSTIQKIICKWRRFQATANLPRSGCPSKFNPRAKCNILKKVFRNPRVT